MTKNLAIMKLLVRLILENPHAFKWSIQGLGMLRLYLSKEVRMHVWSPQNAVTNVSELHDHPWDLHSTVIVGRLRNVRYEITTDGDPHMMRTLKCGQGGCLMDEPEKVGLTPCPTEVYEAGESYVQSRTEIHRSMPEMGTVTIIQRTFAGDEDHARVFWPVGLEWVSAEPRPATYDEISLITKAALVRWFGYRAPQSEAPTFVRDGEQLVCYPRAIADRHTELLHLCEDYLAGAADGDLLARMKRTVDALHLHTSSESPWPVPIHPETRQQTTSTPKTSSP